MGNRCVWSPVDSNPCGSPRPLRRLCPCSAASTSFIPERIPPPLSRLLGEIDSTSITMASLFNTLGRLPAAGTASSTVRRDADALSGPATELSSQGTRHRVSSAFLSPHAASRLCFFMCSTYLIAAPRFHLLCVATHSGSDLSSAGYRLSYLCHPLRPRSDLIPLPFSLPPLCARSTERDSCRTLTIRPSSPQHLSAVSARHSPSPTSSPSAHLSFFVRSHIIHQAPNLAAQGSCGATSPGITSRPVRTLGLAKCAPPLRANR